MTELPPAGEPKAVASATIDGKYVMIVAVLMMMIIGALGALWIRERRGRLAAEETVAQQQTMIQQISTQSLTASALQQMIQPRGEGVQPVLPAECELKAVQLDGQARTAIVISPEAGRRIGSFREGTVLIVGAATEPERTSDGQPAPDPAVP